MASSMPPSLLLLLLLLSFLWTLSSAVEVLLNGFNASNLSLFANATLEPFPSSSRLLRRLFMLSLTSKDPFSLGRALLPDPIPTKSSSLGVLSFYVSFLFSMATVPQALPGHGLSFLFAPSQDTLGATSSQHLGLFNRSSDGDPSSRVLAVEFDVFGNPELHDMNGNHVGVNRNSLNSIQAAAAGYWLEDGVTFESLTLNDGSNYQAWVDYAGAKLNVTMAPAKLGVKPRRPLISFKIDLSDVFLDDMYVGFAASNGQLMQHHRVLGLSFSYTNSSASTGLITTDLPDFITLESDKTRLLIILPVSATVIAILMAGIIGLWVANRRRRRDRGNRGELVEEMIEEWESEYWPHRIEYHQIAAATDGFSGSNLVGQGGNGKVYKGLLGGEQVAVKVFSQTNEAEAKHFSSEVRTLGRLKHRNLVGLRGWCRTRRATASKMILVYDYMKNGSLDQWIFGDGKRLDWQSRVRILREVAAAVLYLHEGWGGETVVLHRDVKASNVMLDGDMTGRLGDFGLARAHRRGLPLGTTQVMGTVGYLAPEVVRTGRATTATDVYAFGVLTLELASGRRAVEDGRPPLVTWSREVVKVNGDLAVLEARMRESEGFDDWEAVRLVAVGLACTSEDAVTRPTMRQVVRMLEAEEQEVAEDGARGRAEATSWLLDARLRTTVESDRAWGQHQRPQPRHHLTINELRNSISICMPLTGSDIIVQPR
ncbi:L-type lectin-domain containing receptor kinase VII.1-like [Zingiber officinale]|uniref:L-type lectin-domain containing receptor kinase VII.1-like n=1 Tax=Zingiber officinale TaxID=94328 RepID=UPI001C4ACE8F|nr:L-type lectin-domain containing receptor kinase VII.1-like [Zingiber officinale]